MPSITVIHAFTIVNETISLFMFRYWLPAGSTDSLTMHVLRNGQLSDVLWKQSGVASSSWEVAEVPVSSPVEFKVTKLSDWRL